MEAARVEHVESGTEISASRLEGFTILDRAHASGQERDQTRVGHALSRHPIFFFFSLPHQHQLLQQ